MSMFKKRQHGGVLIMAMIMLLLMSMLGLAGIEITGLEEKMVFNMRDRQSAFEAAEAALLDGEKYLESVDVIPPFNGENGLYTPKQDGTQHWDDWDALGDSFRTMRSQVEDNNNRGFQQLHGYATYIIEKLDSVEPNNDSAEAGNQFEEQSYYRITARGIGLTASSEVMLQSVYKL